MQDLDELKHVFFFNLCWIWSKEKTSVSSFYKENNFKPCLTKQLLNMFKLWCEWGIRLKSVCVLCWLSSCLSVQSDFNSGRDEVIHIWNMSSKTHNILQQTCVFISSHHKSDEQFRDNTGEEIGHVCWNVRN